ncbi:hypothetical protein X736_26440 [Mesorhizobium sp. L2C089B000]|nr:hypothetical protein X736_26440 [Mesorhizobium sp. L2C089B000]
MSLQRLRQAVAERRPADVEVETFLEQHVATRPGLEVS